MRLISMAGAVVAAALAGPVASAAVPAAPAQAVQVSEAKAVVPVTRKAEKRRPSLAGGKSYRANGKREVARRLHQIASGRLTVANGLAA